MISAPNSTGAYELDLSLVDQFDLAWREMHVKTDVFCSGSIVLPDIAGRLINVGGWSLESTFGLRLYTPDGSPEVNGTNDWEENWEILSLQVCKIVGRLSQVMQLLKYMLIARTVVSYCCDASQRIYSRHWR